MKKKPPEPNSINYYIEKVIDYRTEYETSDSVEYSYPPVVAELLLSILISVRAIRLSLPLAISLLIARAFF